jgi:spore coat protein CotH
MRKQLLGYTTLIVLIFINSACRKVDLDEQVTGTVSDYSDWTETTHSNNVDPDYSVVFEQNTVLRFDIAISSTNWSIMQTDLDEQLGSSGGGPGGVGIGSSEYDMIWVPCTFKFNDTEWYNVGVRYKGNSSLQSAYQSGNNKLSFKLDFDEFEDDYPDLANQRFYGFKQLNLNNNYDDASLMREKVGADLFRNFGLASAQTTFCVVYVDHGDGPQYYGVYTLVEEVDDTVLESQFNDDNGNLYKPDGDAASFAAGTYDESELVKKSNEDENDYSDVEALYSIINSSDRTTNVEQWKANLSSVFNVDGFLKWLAANTVMQNWDTYGKMTHNYFLYNNPADSKLTWIPWDNNEALQSGKSGGALSLSLSEVGNGWPLIRYLMDVDEYEAQYKTYALQFIEEVFIPSEMTLTYSTYYDLLKDYAYAERSGYSYINYDSEFDQAVNTLKTHVQSRNSAVMSFVD